jgi:hypothetical protein
MRRTKAALRRQLRAAKATIEKQAAELRKLGISLEP